MNRNFDRCLAAVLSEEGGFANNAKDPGGATNMGVTLATFQRFIKPKGTIEDLKALTKDQAGVVFRRQYWDAVLGAKLPDGVDLAVFDFAINSGPDRAIRTLQGLTGATVDGKIGPATLAAVEKADRAQLINDICDERLSFLKRAKNPKSGKLLWPDFGKGWSSRVLRIRRLALGLSVQPPEGAPVVVTKQVEVEKHVAVDVKAPGRAIADAATGGGIGSGVLGGTLQTLQDQLTPFSAAGGWISKLVVTLIILSAVLTVGGLAYRWYATHKKHKKIAAMNMPVVTVKP